MGRVERLVERSDLLIMDELSYISFKKYESEANAPAPLLTINLPISRWTELVENAAMVFALVDWLTLRTHILDMSGEFYRLLYAQDEAGK